jgi:hypothetical protein
VSPIPFGSGFAEPEPNRTTGSAGMNGFPFNRRLVGGGLNDWLAAADHSEGSVAFNLAISR